MKRFHAPYNFVPATGVIQPRPDNPAAPVATASPVRHDLWQAGLFSGRIFCTLTTTSPLVVGAQQQRAKDSDPAHVSPFTLDGRPAIPGSSLRGMIGNLIETLSQSSLRILEEREFSVRKPARAGHALSAVGRLCLDSTGQIRLQPLTLPLLSVRNAPARLERRWLTAFGLHVAPPAVLADRIALLLPAYIHGYRTGEQGRELDPGSFLHQHPALPSSIRDSPLATLTLDLPRLEWNASRELLGGTGLGDNKLLIARVAYDGSVAAEPGFKRMQAQGHFKILGIDKREKELPSGKKHELFIALHPGNQTLPCLPITAAALEDFQWLLTEARQRDPDLLPLLNKGCDGLSLNAHAAEGQLVFFDLDASGRTVTELSYSGIWRRRARQSLFEAFTQPDARDPLSRANLLPLSAARTSLTPAERLLGVVSDDDRGASAAMSDVPQALASRLSVSNARSAQPVLLEERKVLQVLGSPKPPSPALYFGQPDKMKFTGSPQLQPNGRKFYLPHPLQQRHIEDAASSGREQRAHPDRDKLKMSVEAIKAGQCFQFEISVENLSQAEMGLLLRALRPAVAYEHRLGLGKPLGLGHVQLEVIGIAGIDRGARYSPQGWAQPRYTQLWRSAAGPALPELRVAADANVVTHPLDPQDPAVGWDQSLVDARTLAIVATLGNAAMLEPDTPVHSPRTEEQMKAGAEDELFKWSVQNDAEKDDQRQWLRPVQPGEPLPTLQARPAPPKSGPRR